MKFVFFGTPRFAAAVLDALIKRGAVPAAVVANPDKPVGRKKIITPPETKTLIDDLKIDIPVFQPEKIDKDFLMELRKLEADLFIVAAYGKLLSDALIDIPKYGVVNIHPSLLPKYRGASPIQSAILNGEEKTAITLFKIDSEMDHGPVFMTEEIVIGNNDNTPSLLEKVAIISADMIADRLLPNIASLVPVPQNHDEATYTKKFVNSDGFIEYANLERAKRGEHDLAPVIDRKIRALYPEPGCWTMDGTKRLKLLDSEVIDEKLKLKSIQYEGKNPVVLK